MPEPARIYWDACAWIAYIQKEMPGPDSSFTEPRYELCRSVLLQAVYEAVTLLTSAYTLAEVCKRAKDPTSPGVDLASFFNQQYILLMNVDKQIGLRAQSLQLAGVGKTIAARRGAPRIVAGCQCARSSHFRRGLAGTRQDIHIG
jgi:hypothetical protein